MDYEKKKRNLLYCKLFHESNIIVRRLSGIYMLIEVWTKIAFSPDLSNI